MFNLELPNHYTHVSLKQKAWKHLLCCLLFSDTSCSSAASHSPVHEDHPHFPVFVLSFWKHSHPSHQPKILCFFSETFLNGSPSSFISPLPLLPKLGVISSLFWIPFVLASLMGFIIIYCICLWTHLPAPYHIYGHAHVHAKDWERVLLIFVLCAQNIHSRCSHLF